MPDAFCTTDKACCPAISAGHVVSLRDALNGSHFAYLPLYHAGEQGGVAGERGVPHQTGRGSGNVDPPAAVKAVLTQCYFAVPADPLPTDAQHNSSGGGSPTQQQLRLASSSGQPEFAALCPQGPIRLLIGVASRCCTAEVRGVRVPWWLFCVGLHVELQPCVPFSSVPCSLQPPPASIPPLVTWTCHCPQAQAKRQAIRRTWAKMLKDHVPGAALRFILAQARRH